MQAMAPLPAPAVQKGAISVRTAAGQTIQVSPSEVCPLPAISVALFVCCATYEDREPPI